MRLKSILLTAALFVFAPSIHAQQELGPNYTIGYGGAFQKTQSEGWEDVLRRCLMQYGRAEWMPGIYQFDEALVGSFSGARIVGSKLTVLKPATSGSVGLFNFTGGSNITLEGFTVKSTSFLAAQSWIKISSGVSYAAITIAATGATTLTDSANGFLTAGFLPGKIVTIGGFTGAGILTNLGRFTITAVDAGTMTVSGPSLTADAAGESVTISEMTGGKNITIDDMVFEAAWSTQPTASSQAVAPVGTATDASCVKMLDLVRTSDLKITNCTFLPDHGAKSISATHGNGMLILGNRFGNNIDAGLGSLADLAINVPRLSNIVIEWDRVEWSQIVANKFWSLGTGNDAASGNYWDSFYEVPHIIKIVGSLNGALTSETGHNIIANNTLEYNCTPKQVAIFGAPSTNVTGNIFGLIVAEADCGPNAIGEGALIFTDGDGGGSGSDTCQGANVFGNDFHNNGLSASSASNIHAQMTSDLKIGGNTFAVVNTVAAIEIGSSSCESISISGNSFRGDGANAANPIHLNSGGAISNGFYAGNNDFEGFTTAICVDNDSGASTDYFVHGLVNFSTGNPYIPSIVSILGSGATVTSSAVINRADPGGSFVTDGWQVGDLASMVGLDAAAENGRVYVVATVAATALTFSGTPITTDAADTGNDMIVVKVGGSVVTNASLD